MTDKQSPGPEKQIGPFQAGIGVNIWLHEAETEHGTRIYRTVTLSPRRIVNLQTGEWEHANGYYLDDLPALIFALQKAQEFVFEKPIPALKTK
jgi:hypothetical protein